MLASLLWSVVRRRCFALLFLAGLVGCTESTPAGEVADIISHNDFESSLGWGGVGPDQLTRDRAHSGNFAICVDARREFSFTYEASTHVAHPHPLKGLRIDAWVLLPSPSSRGRLVVEVDDPTGKPVYNQAYVFVEHQPVFGKWAPVRAEFRLPANLTTEDRLKIYLWRSDATDATYLDDLTIHAIE